MPLLWQIFATNVAILVVATAVLVVSPATISFPIALIELVTIGLGGAVMLALNFAILRRVLAPLRDLTNAMREVDPLRPGQRIRVSGPDAEVTSLTAAFNEMLDRLERERRESARRALSAQESERLRIARELHDEVGQSLTAVLLGLDAAAHEGTPSPGTRLDESRATTRESLENVRRIARELRPEALDDLGLVSALTSLATRLDVRSDLMVDRRLSRDLPPLSPEAELVIYRVAQEAMTNVVRHADARRLELALDRTRQGVALTVADDGRGVDGLELAPGLDAPLEHATGILGMRERALLIGASLTISSAAGGGTQLRLDVPCP